MLDLQLFDPDPADAPKPKEPSVVVVKVESSHDLLFDTIAVLQEIVQKLDSELQTERASNARLREMLGLELEALKRTLH
ncbi:hypothetical protein [Paraburkholderia sp. GAS448]|uniref:hypothetical protein n=1 Tax=Paraburkholderia sp. GAS448 TaxID=3035136 RepID=UPI003D21A833